MRQKKGKIRVRGGATGISKRWSSRNKCWNRRGSMKRLFSKRRIVEMMQEYARKARGVG